jgi:hypothetical protein
MPQVADVLRKTTFGFASVLNSVLPIIYYTSHALPPEVVIGVNVCNTILLLISERSNTIENTIKKVMDDVKSGNVTQRSLIIAPPPAVSNEPVSREIYTAVNIDEPPNTARDYIHVRPIMHKETGRIEWVPDIA